ncbi:TrkA C-terminal domain-containing protein, partial [Cetobacterium sp.]|uniref:TrkA C-terminal domain-containing protein n=1 Tax=Cetobacterium sp. TaxID=2071632 RepID=UPI003EE43BF7
LAFKFGFITNSDYSAFIITTIASCIIFPIIFEKLMPSEDKQKVPVSNEIIVRELILNNADFENKPLKNCTFKKNCRIFSYIRNDTEIIPNGDSILNKGDILVLVGSRNDVEDTIKVLEE